MKTQDWNSYKSF